MDRRKLPREMHNNEMQSESYCLHGSHSHIVNFFLLFIVVPSEFIYCILIGVLVLWEIKTTKTKYE